MPPLQEDALEPKPVASTEDLKRLRDECRQMPVLRLETIMDGVRRACGSAAWQRIGWRDYRLEFALDELIYRIKRATERPDLSLPVRFGDVPAGVAEKSKGVMTATRSVKLRSATRCIFLVDGDVDVVEAKECLILTTGRAKVPYGSANIILAGGASKAPRIGPITTRTSRSGSAAPRSRSATAQISSSPRRRVSKSLPSRTPCSSTPRSEISVT